MAAVFIILLVLVAIYCVMAPTREEEAARPIPPIPQDASQEERELIQIKRKIDSLNGIVLPTGTWREIIGHIAAIFGGGAAILFLVATVIAFSNPSSFSNESRLEVLGGFAVSAAVFALYVYLAGGARGQLVKMKNRAKMLEDFLSAKRSGNYDEATLNEIKKALETKMKYDNEADEKRLVAEMIKHGREA